MDVGVGELIAIGTGVITLSTSLAVTIGKLVGHVIEQQKLKKVLSQDQEWGETTGVGIKALRSGHTADIAVQGVAIRNLADQVEKLEELIRSVKSSVDKDLPHLVSRLDDKVDGLSEVAAEESKLLRDLHRSMDNYASVTRALHNFLASSGRGDGA